jgi:hypothetical protein
MPNYVDNEGVIPGSGNGERKTLYQAQGENSRGLIRVDLKASGQAAFMNELTSKPLVK